MSKYDDIKKAADEAQKFSEGLWESGDKANAHFHEGRAAGLIQAIQIMKNAND